MSPASLWLALRRNCAIAFEEQLMEKGGEVPMLVQLERQVKLDEWSTKFGKT